MNIISTVGPSLQTNNKLRKLYYAGCSGFRFTAAHTEKDKASKQMEFLHTLNPNINVILDLQGHKIRISSILKSIVNFENKEEVYICSQKYFEEHFNTSDKKLIPLDIEFDFSVIKQYDYFSIKDGSVVFKKINNCESDAILCKIKGHGFVRPRNGINIKDFDRSFLNLSKKDKENIKFGLDNNVDIMYLSYVEDSTYVVKTKNYIKRLVKNNSSYTMPKLYAKLETLKGINNFGSILRASDGIVLGRGDIHNEVNSLQYPALQEKIIKKMKNNKKELVLATHILTTITYKNKPSISEISDLYRFVKGKVNSIVLVTETSICKNPKKAVSFAKELISQYSEFNNIINKPNEEERLTIVNY